MSEVVLTEKTELSREDSDTIKRLTENIDLLEPTLSITYGSETMADIARFADELLSRVRTKDAGPVGESLGDLMGKLKDFDTAELEKKSFLERLPVVGSYFNSSQRAVSRVKTISDQVGLIGTTLEESMIGLLKDISILEDLYNYNKQFHHDLSLCILAGQERLRRAKEEELPSLQREAEKANDGLTAQRVKDFSDAILRFERRLHDLQLSRTITLQTAPQIRLIQSNSQSLVEKIQTSILSTIPIWKGQLVLGLTIQGQKNSAEMQRRVTDTTNELLEKNAALLQDSAVSTAKEVERSVVDIKTLRNVQEKLIATIEETITIAQEGREKRFAVEEELLAMEDDLKARLTNLAAVKRDSIVAGASTPLSASKGAGPALSGKEGAVDGSGEGEAVPAPSDELGKP